MALLAEELVEEWLRRDGYFTIRGARDGNSEADLLAVKHGDAPTLRHIEVQCSANPTSFICAVPRDIRKRDNVAPYNARKRPHDVLQQGVIEWIEKKFNDPRIDGIRQRLWPGTWHLELVIWNHKSNEELQMIRDRGIEVIDFGAVLKRLRSKSGVLKKAEGWPLVELITELPK